jgi:hypothetical protein
MCEESWKDCVNWLTRVNLLPPEHRANNSSQATIKDLAYTLRDGVQLCRLLNLLHPNSLDLKDISQRPQMAQVGWTIIGFTLFKTIGAHKYVLDWVVLYARHHELCMLFFICFSFSAYEIYGHFCKSASIASILKTRICFSLQCYSTFRILGKFCIHFQNCLIVLRLFRHAKRKSNTYIISHKNLISVQIEFLNFKIEKSLGFVVC